MTIRFERMSPAFARHDLGIETAGVWPVLHHFTAGEPDAESHSLPWSSTSHVLTGGYVEEVVQIAADGSWTSEFIERLRGSVHHVEAAHIHRIAALPAGECWTLVLAGPVERETRLWRFGERVESRRWDGGW